MHKVRFMMKSGESFFVSCEEAHVWSRDNEMTRYKLDGLKGNKPLYIRVNDVSAVIDEGEVEEACYSQDSVHVNTIAEGKDEICLSH